jgi:cyanate lyase
MNNVIIKQKNNLDKKLEDLSQKFGVDKDTLKQIILEYVLSDEDLALKIVKEHLGTEPDLTTPG